MSIKESNIWRAALVLILGTFVSKFLGFIREVIFAHQFGASVVSDAFLLTKGIPDALFSALAVSINMNFIPLYYTIESYNDKNRFASNVLNTCLLLTLFGGFLIFLFPQHVLNILSPSLNKESLYYAIVLLCIISFSIIPIPVGRLFQAYSEANNQFNSTALLGIVTNIALILSYLLATERTFYLLGFGVVAASFFSMMMTFWYAKQAGFRYFYVCNLRDEKLVSMVALSWPIMCCQFLESAGLLVDKSLAAKMGVGIISGMSYAALLAWSANSMIVNSIAISSFPTLSKIVAEKKRKEFTAYFLKYFRAICIVLSPICAFMIMLSDDIVRLVLQHGALQSSSSVMIADCLRCYGIGMIPFGISNYLMRGFYSFQDTKTPAYITLFALGCNIFLSIWSAPYWGYRGVALATSGSYMIASGLMICFFSKKYGINIFSQTLKTLISCICMILVPLLITYIASNMLTDQVSLFIKMVFLSTLFFVPYVILFFLFHKNTFYESVSLIRKR